MIPRRRADDSPLSFRPSKARAGIHSRKLIDVAPPENDLLLCGYGFRARVFGAPRNDSESMTRISAIPGLPPLIAALGLLALWEFAARVFDISGLPPAHAALRELPAILSDPEALLNILASIRRMLIGFTLALAFAIPV